jgi:hypothetical protein
MVEEEEAAAVAHATGRSKLDRYGFRGQYPSVQEIKTS